MVTNFDNQMLVLKRLRFRYIVLLDLCTFITDSTSKKKKKKVEKQRDTEDYKRITTESQRIKICYKIPGGIVSNTYHLERLPRDQCKCFYEKVKKIHLILIFSNKKKYIM